jgi:hypothetical protein
MAGCGRLLQLSLMFGEIPVAPVIATDLAVTIVVSRPRLSFRAVAHAKSSAVDLRECGERFKCKAENDAYQECSHHGVHQQESRDQMFFIRNRI